jgi:hypothetical protein
VKITCFKAKEKFLYAQATKQKVVDQLSNYLLTPEGLCMARLVLQPDQFEEIYGFREIKSLTIDGLACNYESECERLLRVPFNSCQQTENCNIRMKLPLETILQRPKKQYALVLEKDAKVLRNEVQCPCWETSQTGEMIRCSKCERMQHLYCITSKGVASLRKPYFCPQCAMASVDGLSLPMATVVRPFTV